MGTITKVLTIIPAEGNKPFKAKLSHDNQEYGSFDPAIFADLKAGSTIEATLTTEQKKRESDGRVFTNRYLGEWRLVTPPGETTPEAAAGTPKDTVPAEVWDAKDRAIAMEAAFKAAAEYMKVSPTVSVIEWRLAARAAYTDIQAARSGMPFPTITAPQPRPSGPGGGTLGEHRVSVSLVLKLLEQAARLSWTNAELKEWLEKQGYVVDGLVQPAALPALTILADAAAARDEELPF